MLGVVSEHFPGIPLSVLAEEPLSVYLEIIEHRAYARARGAVREKGWSGPKSPLEELAVEIMAMRKLGRDFEHR